jgi:hypothetical protein
MNIRLRGLGELYMSEPTVFHIQKGRLVKMKDPGKFGRGDCYLIDAGMKIYLWIGPNSSVDEKFLTAASAVMRDTSREGTQQLRKTCPNLDIL